MDNLYKTLTTLTGYLQMPPGLYRLKKVLHQKRDVFIPIIFIPIIH